MDNITPLGPRVKGRRIPANASRTDFEMLAAIYDASGDAHIALRDFARAVMKLMEAHPEHETLGPLLVSFGIDPDEWADLLSIGPSDDEEDETE